MAATIPTAHPGTVAQDLMIGQAYWAMTVPPLWFLRKIIGHPSLPKADLTNKIVIVTGCNRGVGARTALHLAEMGATVVLACRKGQATQAKEGILKELSERGVTIAADKLEPMELDLADMKSVRAFADAFKARHKTLDILVNNAGVSEPGLTKEGYSITFTCNYIGPYQLTEELYSVIKSTENARVVNLASVFHHYGDPGKWEEAATGRRGDTGSFDVLTHVYADSKLANLMHALDLRRRLAADGASATAFAVHPGNCRTDLWRYVPTGLHGPFDAFMRVCFLSPDLGCHTSIHAAVAPLDTLKESDGTLARFLQPYWCPPLLGFIRHRAGQQIGPFAGCVVGDVSLPENLDAALDELRNVSKKLVSDLTVKQRDHIQPDPAAHKAIHPVAETVYPTAPHDVPIRY